MHLTKASWGIAIAAVATVCLGAALVLEHGFGMVPCALCVMQRLWFALAGLIAISGVLHNPRWGIYPLGTGLGAVVGGGFALRQIWLESLPPGEAPACGASIQYLFEAGMAGEALRAMALGTADCADTPPFLGLSLAVWALAGFGVILAAAAMQWRAKA